MINLAQSDFFINFVSVAQIFIFVFLVFILALLVKVLSDLSHIAGRLKRESDELIEDVSDLRREAKGVVKAIISYAATFISAVGVKKFVGLVAGFLESKQKRTKKRTTSKTKE